MTKNNCLYLVIPCYQEEEVLPETASRLTVKMQALIQSEKISADSHVIFVNDGSKDRTWEIISSLHEQNSMFSGLNLSRNRGHQNAVLAGLMTARNYCDMAISMDADLQDDINAIDEMVDKYLEGCDIVYGVRSSRKTDKFMKRFTAELYYKILNWMGAEVVFNHADYRLMSRRALDGLSEYSEVNLYLRGIVPQLGFRTATVSYERAERFAGESKYPVKKMLHLAVDGITSFSIKPISMLMKVGLVIALLSVVVLLWGLIAKFTGHAVDGWTTLIASIWLMGGLQLLGLGVIGSYVGKIYLETKHRPRYIIESFLHADNLHDKDHKDQ